MAATLQEKAFAIFEKADTETMKEIYKDAKKALLSKIDAEQKQYAEKLNNLQQDKDEIQKINGN